MIFVDLRDREEGFLQVVFNPAFSEEALKIAETVRSEYVVEVQGTVSSVTLKQLILKLKLAKLKYKLQILK
ncbi:OB-fold nucleic acid binding domain-containing protein [Staphylococcus aureus]